MGTKWEPKGIKKESKGEKMNKICVYAICKNEKKFVDKWLESMSEADYIAVLDTGSDDGTYELLKEKSEKEYKGKMFVGQKTFNPWRFDAARNESLKLVPEDTNIFFCTDLDELLEPGWAKPLREKWNPLKHERAIYKYAWSHLEDGTTPGRVFYYDKIHSKNWKWKHPVHEMLVGTDNDKNTYENENTLNLFEQVFLHHFPDLSKSRGTYLPLLELRAKESPDDYYGLIYLAHEYYYRKQYSNSINTLYKVLSEFPGKITSLEKASCYLFLGDSYYAEENVAESMTHYKKAIEIEPTYREPYLNLARVLMSQNECQIAYDYLKKALSCTYRHYTWLERDTAWTYELFDVLSLSAYYSGNKKDSLAYAVKAYHENPSNERLKDNIEKIINTMSDRDYI